MNIKLRLTVLSFLQFFVWGAWLITIGTYCLNAKGWTFPQFGAIFSTLALSSLFMPALTGIIADKWINAEKQSKTYDAIIMIGETLSQLSNGYLLPATHRVRTLLTSRISLVYQLRADPDALLDSTIFTNSKIGTHSKPFKLTGAEFYNKEIQGRTSVNGSY